MFARFDYCLELMRSETNVQNAGVQGGVEFEESPGDMCPTLFG